MQGVVTTQSGSFEPTVFESVLDTVAGGGCLDPTGLSTLFPDLIVPAGTLVGEKSKTTGLHKVVTITNATPDTYDVVPIGFTMHPVKIDNNPLVGICIEGAVRRGMVWAGFGGLGTIITDAQIDDIKDNLPKITFVTNVGSS